MIHLDILQYDADDPPHTARAAVLDEPANDCILQIVPYKRVGRASSTVDYCGSATSFVGLAPYRCV